MTISCDTWENGSTDRRAADRRAPRTAAGLLAALAVVTGGSPSIAAGQQLDAGQLAIMRGGQRVGVESFRVWRAGPNLNAAANIEPSGNRGGEFQVGLELDGQLRPVRYQRRGSDGPALDGTWALDRVRIHMVTPEGERWKEVPSRGPGSVLDEGVAHHYLVLLHVLRETGGPVTILVPTLGESARATLSGEGADEVTVDARSIAATRYDIQIGGQARSVWLDAEGRLLRVRDPGSGLEAIRLPNR
jgi:hypothetical protein